MAGPVTEVVGDCHSFNSHDSVDVTRQKETAGEDKGDRGVEEV